MEIYGHSSAHLLNHGLVLGLWDDTLDGEHHIPVPVRSLAGNENFPIDWVFDSGLKRKYMILVKDKCIPNSELPVSGGLFANYNEIRHKHYKHKQVFPRVVL